MHISVYIDIHVRTYIHILCYMLMYVHIHIYIYLLILIYIHIYTYIYICISTCIFACLELAPALISWSARAMMTSEACLRGSQLQPALARGAWRRRGPGAPGGPILP